jgi:hypothetical protein
MTPRPVGVMTLKGRTLSPLALAFIDCAREGCGWRLKAEMRWLAPNSGGRGRGQTC